MKLSVSTIPWKWVRWAVAVVVIAAGGLTWNSWWPPLQGWVHSMSGQFRGGDAGRSDHGDAGHAAHDDHPGHAEESSIALSPQAMRNLGLTPEYLRPIALTTYRRTIRVPAIIVEKPGWTHLQVASPMTAIVTRVHVATGAAVRPGQLLFELRLTHEDLVNSQTEFLKTLGVLAVERKELQRVQGIAQGAIPGNVLLERQYAVQKLESELDAQREALKLHGLSDEQVRAIEEQRKLLRTIEIFAPTPGGRGPSEFRLTTTQPVSFDPDAPATPAAAPLLVLEDLRVHQGQALTAGETLCVLAEYSHLYIEGQAFEKDAPAIMAARVEGWPIAAQFEGTSAGARVEGLSMAYVANAIDVDSRTLHFYVELPNELLPQPRGSTGGGFITWKYRPGQRLELLVPVEEWPDEIVLPVDAVAREGAESFVFLQNGKHFDRRPVHVKYRDPSQAVIAHDGSLFPGDVVALRGAHQLLMALKNKSGGGVDPHAGHTH